MLVEKIVSIIKHNFRAKQIGFIIGLLIMSTVASVFSPVVTQACGIFDPKTGKCLENFYSDNDILFYDEGNDIDQCSASGTSDVKIVGKDNAEKAWNYLTAKGLSPEQAAGIIGNLMAESGLNPKASNKGMYLGIAQLSKNDRWAKFAKQAKSAGKDVYDFGTQLEYVYKEANERGNIAGIKKYNDVSHTAWYWGRFYEVAIIGGGTSTTPLTNVQDLKSRTAFAKSTLSEFKGTTGGDNVTIDDAKAGPASCGGSTVASCENANAKPPDDFEKVQYQGKTFDKRTLFMIKVADSCSKQYGVPPIKVTQGSYNPGGVAASGSSHAKGGAIDINIVGLSKAKIDKLVAALRQAGFAAWYRDEIGGPNNTHIHAVALGAPKSGPGSLGSPGQITLYCNGGDGLSSNGKDRHLSTIGRPLPDWAVSKSCSRYP